MNKSSKRYKEIQKKKEKLKAQKLSGRPKCPVY